MTFAGPTPVPAPQTLRAALWMLGAVGAFSLMAVAGRAVSSELDTFEIMMYRSLFGVVAVCLAGWALGTLGQVRLRRPGLHLARNLCHFAGQNLWFFAITAIPLAEVFALEFTTPLWVLLLSPLLLGERLTGGRMLAAAIGFAGILIVARPAPDTVGLGTLAATAAAIGFAGTYIFTKRLTRSEPLIAILFWMTLSQSAFGVVAAGLDGDIAIPSAAFLPWLAVIACCGIVAHLCITSALALASATLVAPMDFTRLPVIAVVGLLVYGEPVDAMVILGAVVIFGANYLNIWLETRNS